MCMDDVRIGRSTTTSTARVGVAELTWTLIAPQSVDRYSLLSWLTSGDGIAYWCGSNGPPDPLFLPTGGLNETLLLDLQHHGDMVRQPWYAISPSGAGNVVVVTTDLRAQ